MNINFRLEKKKKENNKGNIRIDFHYNGKRFRYFTGIIIKENLWNINRQRLKSSAGSSLEINQRLDNISRDLEDIYYQILNDNLPPSNHLLRMKLNEKIKGINQNLSFFEYANEYIERSKNFKKMSTVKGYIYTVNDLLRFQKYRRVRIDWDTIDMKFYDDYKIYQFKVKENSHNLFGKRIKDLKAILNDATKMGSNKHLMYKGFKVLNKEAYSIYLTDLEIDKIYKLNLSFNIRLEKVRDIFIVCSLTGVRFSDYKNITNENISEDNTIKIHSQKTDTTYHTICEERTVEILKKYDFTLPKISRTNFNKYIKEVGKLANITEEVIKDTYKSGVSISIKKYKYELITSHTARRSFATNLYLKGFASKIIMAATGHKKETTFLKYLKITNQESAKILSLNYNRKVG